ncbi:MAG: GGDEF domain-containing protein [Ruminococcus sp.]|nr:GGDEF domain-containing protein [Ruminococcus sp.]
MSKNKPSLKNIRRLQLYMILGYALIVITAVAAVSGLTAKKTDEVLKNKVISMSSSLNVQMKLNLDSYLSRMETIGTLAFGVPEFYTYDATDPNNDEFDALSKEKIITDKLYSLCIMENFVDYGVVYRNNRTVGKISNGTASLFGDKIFDELHSMIKRQRTNDGWAAGYNSDFRRIYYVKSIHENALLVISFYATELQQVFDNPETLSDMAIRLTDSSYNIIYSSEKDEVGTVLPENIAERVRDHSSSTVMDDAYLVSVNACGDDWFVICSIPTEIILGEKKQMQYYIIMVGVMAAALALLISTELSFRLVSPVKAFVSSLDTKASTDQLTGILNKKAFEEMASQRLETSLSIERHALILLDLDNFKGVNDNLGHAYGDKVLSKTGSILRGTFSTEDFLGRVGGDEFAVLLNGVPENDNEFLEFVKGKCRELCEQFASNYTGDNGDYKISASIGVSLCPDHGRDFDVLYKASDSALYISKKKGKDTYTIYSPETQEVNAQ